MAPGREHRVRFFGSTPFNRWRGKNANACGWREPLRRLALVGTTAVLLISTTAYADVPPDIPPDIKPGPDGMRDPQALRDLLRGADGPKANDIWDEMTPEEEEAVDKIIEAENEKRRADQARAEEFKESLESMAGDRWAAQLAAFFTATLFDPSSTTMDQAYVQNLRTLQQINALTPEQLCAQQKLEEQNARVAGQQAQQQQAAFQASCKQIQTGYGRQAGQLIGPGYEDLGAEIFHKTAALQTQDAHMGQLLQFRAQLNTLKIGTGAISDGSFVGMPGADSLRRLDQINNEIGMLRATDGDETRITTLEAERAKLLKIDGVAAGPATTALRTGFIDGLTPLAQDVATKFKTFTDLKDSDLYRDFLRADRDLYDLQARGPPVTGMNAEFDGRVYEQWEADKARLTALKGNPIGLQVQAAEQAYLEALGQTPFLSAPVDPAASGDAVPMWQYLTQPSRSASADQTALDQSIEFLDQSTMQVIDQFGTLVETVPLLDAYGSPVFGPLRIQVANDLAGICSGVDINMDALASLHAANMANTEVSRAFTNLVIGGTQVVVGGVIVLVPPTAPVLVPVEIALTGLQVGVEGMRTYSTWSDYQRAKLAASVGSGASLTGAKMYEDLFDAQSGSFVLVLGTAPLSVAGSGMSLAVANEMKAAAQASKAARMADAAAATGEGAGAVRATATATSAVADAPVAAGGAATATRAAPDFEAFQAMTPEQQVAALAGQPDSVKGSLVGRLSNTQQTEFTKAVGQADIGNIPPGLLNQKPSSVFGTEYYLTDKGEELVTGVDEVLTMPAFTSFEDLPPPGSLTGNMTQAEIDALFTKRAGLTGEELRQKADLIRTGRYPSEGWDADTQWSVYLTLRQAYLNQNTVIGAMDDLALLPKNAGPMPEWVQTARLAQKPQLKNAVASGAATNLGGVDSCAGTNIGSASAADRTVILPAPDLPPLPLKPMALDQLLPPGQVPIWMQRDFGVSGWVPPLSWRMTTSTPPAAVRAATVINQPGSIVNVAPAAGQALDATIPAWAPYVIKVFPILCNNLPDSDPACQPQWIFVLSYPDVDAQKVAGLIQQSSDVAVNETNAGRTKQAPPNDPYFSSRGSWGQAYDDQWALKLVGITGQELVAPGGGGKRRAPVVVAVIDTGVAWSHRDLNTMSLWVNEDEIPANGVDDDRNGYIDDIVGWNFLADNNAPWDFDGHGTMVAGIIGASTGNGIGIAGINPHARIMALKALDSGGRSRASYLAEAIVYAANNGARIINLSAGGLRLTKTEQLAIDYAWSRGALVVAAAGNERVALTDYGPGGANHVLTVAATDVNDRPYTYSNTGSQVDIAAPGVDVIGLRAIGTDLMGNMGLANYKAGANIVGADKGYFRASGTSFAAPIVSGVASLLLAVNPALTNAQLERMLVQSAVDIGTPGVDQTTGYGRVDARAALAADPAFLVEARIADVAVVQKDGRPFVQVLGTANADRFAKAWIEVGAGDAPQSFKVSPRVMSAPVSGAVLDEFDAGEFAGAKKWTLRLVTEHRNGRRREARFVLDAG